MEDRHTEKITQLISHSDISFVQQGFELWIAFSGDSLHAFLDILRRLIPESYRESKVFQGQGFVGYYEKNINALPLKRLFPRYPHYHFLYACCISEIHRLVPDGAGINPIEELYLTSNIPSNLHYAKRINKVHLNDETNWSQLDSMKGLDSIIQVNLNDYKRNKVPNCMQRMSRLERLSISNADITELPSWLSELSCLTHLSVWGCRSLSNDDQLAMCLLGCRALTHFRFSSFSWKAHPSVYMAVSELENIQIVDISHHKCDENILKNMDVRGLRMSLKQWEDWHESLLDFSNLEHLEIKDGWGHSRKVYIGDTLGKLKSLQNLKIMLDPLYNCYLPSNFFELKNLRVLKLEGTFAKSNMSRLSDAQDLRVLDISSSNITHLPNKMERLQKLILLETQYNKSTEESLEIPHSLAQIKDLRYLGVDKTPSWKSFLAANRDFVASIDVNLSPYDIHYVGEDYDIQYHKDFFNGSIFFWHYNGK